MSIEKARTAVDYLADLCPDAATAHRALRKSVLGSGPLDAHTCELIVLGGFVTARIESGFKAHAKRLLEDGVSKEILRQAVLVTLGATTSFPVAVEALRWIDELDGPTRQRAWRKNLPLLKRASAPEDGRSRQPKAPRTSGSA